MRTSRELIVDEFDGNTRTFIVCGAGDGTYDLLEVISVRDHGNFRRKWQAIEAIKRPNRQDPATT